jgi:hypothetical protein
MTNMTPIRFATKTDAFAYCLANDIAPTRVVWLAGAQGHAYGVGFTSGYYIANKVFGTFRECAQSGVLCA